MSAAQIQKELRKISDKKKAKLYAGYFKTGKGEYGEGDVFIGISTPDQVKVAKKYIDIPLFEIQKLLKSKIHEDRSVALAILRLKFEKAEDRDRKKIFDFYIKNTKFVNNWDLVDTSAPYISGAFLLNKDKKVLYKLSKSKNLWEKRISIISTYHFIKNKKFEDTLQISEILLYDEHDLIHKAVGWMLREGLLEIRVLVPDLKTEEKFLKKYYKKMPRTMLRYAIERFPELKRKKYLLGKV